MGFPKNIEKEKIQMVIQKMITCIDDMKCWSCDKLIKGQRCVPCNNCGESYCETCLMTKICNTTEKQLEKIHECLNCKTKNLEFELYEI